MYLFSQNSLNVGADADPVIFHLYSYVLFHIIYIHKYIHIDILAILYSVYPLKWWYTVMSALLLSMSLLLLFLTQQALPDDSYTSEDHSVFTTAGRTCIEEGNGAQVLSIVLDEKNQVYQSCENEWSRVLVSGSLISSYCIISALYCITLPYAPFCRT